MIGQGRFVFALVVLCSFFAVGGVASADYTHVGNFSSEGSEPGQLSTPGRAAVEQSTGNLFVVDSGNNRVQVFRPNASQGADVVTTFGGGELSAPWGIAIAESGGQTSVYVADAGNERIVKYDSDEAATPTFTPDASFKTPAKGSGSGQIESFKAALAIDPSTGDLLVADFANKLIQRYEADGTFLSAFDGTGGGGTAFDGPIDVAVNSAGDVYVIDANGPDISQPGGGTSKALRYSGTGAYKATMPPVGTHERVATVAVDPADDSVLISGDQDNVYEAGPAPYQPVLGLFDSANQPLPIPSLDSASTYMTVSGMALESVGRRVYVVLDKGYYNGFGYGNPQVQLFKELVSPAATIDPAGSISQSSATITGTVNPNGLDAEWWVEYKPAAPSEWQSTAPQDAGDGTVPVAVEAELSGLETFTEYVARIVVRNFDATVRSADLTFTTKEGPPNAITQAAAMVGTDTAWLRAAVNPRGLTTHFHFELGTSSGAYSARVPIAGTANAGQGGGLQAFSRKAIDLQPGTTYHYRVVAENALGSSVGDELTFTTKSGAEEAWAYEMVSPPDKNGGAVGTSDPAASGGAVAVSGDAIGYMSPNAFAGSVSSGFKNWYAAFRGAAKWETEPVNLPFRAEPTGGGDGPILSAASEDLSRALVHTNVDPITGELQPRRNLYLHDLRSGATRQLTPDAVSGPQDYIPTRTSTAGVVRAATPSLGHVLIAPQTEARLTADAEPSSPGNPAFYLVDTATGEIEFLTTGPSTIFGAGGTNHHSQNVIAADGSAVVIDKVSGGLHRYDMETGADALVNAAEGTGEPPGEATFLDASRDGRYVFFWSYQQLLPADANGSADVYRYDAAAAPGNRLTLISVDSEPGDGSGAGVEGSMGISRDGGRLYFAGAGQLVAGAPTGAGRKLYLWDNGALKFIALDPAPPMGTADYVASRLGRGKNASIDAAGDFLAFTSGPTLAPPEGGASPCPLLGSYRCNQVYLYDAAASTPTEPDFRCVSCLPAPQVTPWSAGFEQFEGNSGQFLRAPGINVSDDGTVLFATATPLLPEDLNGPGRDYDNSIVPNILSTGQDVYTYRDGELRLVSTGRSVRASYPIGISPDGRTVAFTTADRLSGWDTDDSQDVYAARLGGGLPEPPPPPFACEGDACLTPPVVPDDPTPGSATFNGAANGNAAEPPPKRCAKGKKRVKGKCVKKKAKNAKKKQARKAKKKQAKKQKRANSKRGANR